jgi:KaiC/GvpD/RAD55 family RecA-like ATPase
MNSLLSPPWKTASEYDPKASLHNYDIYDSEGRAVVKVYLRGVSEREAKETHSVARIIVDSINLLQQQKQKREERNDYSGNAKNRARGNGNSEPILVSRVTDKDCEGSCLITKEV